jgi:uncharacterized protein with HEPN domain
VRDHSLFIQDILLAIERIESFTSGMGYDTFVEDDKTLSAVVRKLEIIGEAVKQLPETFTQQHPTIPWKQIAGMRDKLIHFYFGVDPLLVWQTIRNRLPELKAVLLSSMPICKPQLKK